MSAVSCPCPNISWAGLMRSSDTPSGLLPFPCHSRFRRPAALAGSHPQGRPSSPGQAWVSTCASWPIGTPPMSCCEHGVGGYDVSMGLAWRFKLPPEVRGRATLNSLEFLSCSTAISQAIGNDQVPLGSCILCGTDSTSAACWLHSSGRVGADSLQCCTARWMAEELLSCKSTVHSHWLVGSFDGIADCLSRDHNLSVFELTLLLHSHLLMQATGPSVSWWPGLPHVQ